jgi:hypothetical protein
MVHRQQYVMVTFPDIVRFQVLTAAAQHPRRQSYSLTYITSYRNTVASNANNAILGEMLVLGAYCISK